MNGVLYLAGAALIVYSLAKTYRSGKKKDFYVTIAAYGVILALVVFAALWTRANG